MLKFYVRTTGERVLDNSFSQIDYDLSIDYEHNPTKAFISLLKQVQNDNVILLEDDIILCKNFKQHIESVIFSHSNELINFFSYPSLFIFSSKLHCSIFCYNQCTYFPSAITKQIIKYIDEHNEVYNEPSPEKVCKKVLKELNIDWYMYRPCLVQHLDNGSLLGHIRKFSRRSPYFIDYLDELGITYEEARSNENQDKLINLMNEKFKEINKN